MCGYGSELPEERALRYLCEYKHWGERLITATDNPMREAELRNILCPVVSAIGSLNRNDGLFQLHEIVDIIKTTYDRIKALESDPNDCGRHNSTKN